MLDSEEFIFENTLIITYTYYITHLKALDTAACAFYHGYLRGYNSE